MKSDKKYVVCFCANIVVCLEITRSFPKTTGFRMQRPIPATKNYRVSRGRFIVRFTAAADIKTS